MTTALRNPPLTNQVLSDRDFISGFRGKRYHFIGIGGIGMSSLARLLLGWGALVSGSDRADGDMLDTLRREGAQVEIGHAASNIDLADLPDVVVYSKAVPDDNPELALAREKGIRTIHRAELLGQVMASRKAVCVCGTHGKTSTTAMLATILVDAGLDPAVMLGGVYEPIGGNVRGGHGEIFLAEACEAYGSFLSLYPNVAVVTNIEPDHLDKGATFEDIRQSFRTFLERVGPNGLIIAGADSPEVASLLPLLHRPVETYGLHTAAAWTARPGHDGEWEVLHHGEMKAKLNLLVPGEHNVLNALAAIATAASLGVTPEASAQSLDSFTGVDRRFSIRGTVAGVTVVDDYAHHPSEIRATLTAARELVQQSRYSRVIAAFQPHLYSRTALFMDEFADSFEEADAVALTEIYAAREEPMPGVSGEALAQRVRDRWPNKPVFFEPDLASTSRRLVCLAEPGDLVLTMGAGDITTIGKDILAQLESNQGSHG